MLLWEGPLALDALVGTARRVEAMAVGLEAGLATTAVVHDLHAERLPVLPFTCDERAEMESLLDAGVDGIMTNQVERLRDVVGARS